jgi:hypothetical protein
MNYTVVLATHIAMVEGVWKVTGDHVDMAEEILYDLYQNLILWLEEKVEVGEKASSRRKKEKAWVDAFSVNEQFEMVGTRGEGWRRKSQVLSTYGKEMNVSSNTCYAHFNRYEYMFDVTREGAAIYIRLKKDYRARQ